VVAALAGLGAFYALARSLQLGDPIDVIVAAALLPAAPRTAAAAARG